MLTIGIIGFGNSVLNYHLPYLERKQNIKVKAVYRREEDRVNDKEREEYYPEILFTSHFNYLLEDETIDVIVVCTHVDSHVEYAQQILNAGKHALIEKPFTETPQEAKQLFELADSKRLIVMPNQNRRFDGDFLTLKKVLESGKLGNIVEVQSHYDYFKPESINKGFGLVNGLAVHTIDQLISVFGKPNSVHYDVRSQYFPGESDDYIDIDFHYGALKTTVKCSLSVMTEHPKFVVHGDKGSFIKYSSGHQKKSASGPTKVSFDVEKKTNWGIMEYLDENGKRVKEKVPSEVTDYGLLYDQLEACIKYGGEKPIKDNEVLMVLNILNEAVESAKRQSYSVKG